MSYVIPYPLVVASLGAGVAQFLAYDPIMGAAVGAALSLFAGTTLQNTLPMKPTFYAAGGALGLVFGGPDLMSVGAGVALAYAFDMYWGAGSSASGSSSSSQ